MNKIKEMFSRLFETHLKCSFNKKIKCDIELKKRCDICNYCKEKIK